MGLLDQLRLLDRALRDVRVREALRTGDRGGRRLARFAGSVAPADLAVLRAVDARRFEAVALRQAELIRDRWWTPRFPGVLAGTAKALAGTTRDVALGTLASPPFDRREGADDTGSALIGYVLGREDRTNDPTWLADLVAYEYLIAVGLPRRSKGESFDAALEQRIFPEGTRFLEPQKKAKSSDFTLVAKVVVLPLEFPVSQIREALVAGQDVDGELDSEPHVLVFRIDSDAATEHPFAARAHDVIDMIAAAPLAGQKLLEQFDADDRSEVFAVLSALLGAGILAGVLPEAPPPPDPVRVAKAAKAAKEKAKAKGKAKGKASAKGGKPHADSKATTKPAPAKAPAKPVARIEKPAPAPAKAPPKPEKASKPVKAAAKAATPKKATPPSSKPAPKKPSAAKSSRARR